MSDEYVVKYMEKSPEGVIQPAPEKPRPSSRLRRTLLAGLTVIAPLWITGLVLLKLFEWAAGFSRPLIKPFAAVLGNPDWYHPVVGFVITIVIVWLVGLMTTMVLGRRLLQDGREALERLPVVRTIYAPIQRLMETMTSPEKADFKKVILFEYPRKGLWTLGFLAGDVPFQGGWIAGPFRIHPHGSQPDHRLHAHHTAQRNEAHHPDDRAGVSDDCFRGGRGAVDAEVACRHRAIIGRDRRGRAGACHVRLEAPSKLVHEEITAGATVRSSGASPS